MFIIPKIMDDSQTYLNLCDSMSCQFHVSEVALSKRGSIQGVPPDRVYLLPHVYLPNLESQDEEEEEEEEEEGEEEETKSSIVINSTTSSNPLCAKG